MVLLEVFSKTLLFTILPLEYDYKKLFIRSEDHKKNLLSPQECTPLFTHQIFMSLFQNIMVCRRRAIK